MFNEHPLRPDRRLMSTRCSRARGRLPDPRSSASRGRSASLCHLPRSAASKCNQILKQIHPTRHEKQGQIQGSSVLPGASLQEARLNQGPSAPPVYPQLHALTQSPNPLPTCSFPERPAHFVGSKHIPPGLKLPAGTADNHEGHPLSKCLAADGRPRDENLIQIYVHLYITSHRPGTLHSLLAEEWVWPGLSCFSMQLF